MVHRTNVRQRGLSIEISNVQLRPLLNAHFEVDKINFHDNSQTNHNIRIQSRQDRYDLIAVSHLELHVHIFNRAFSVFSHLKKKKLEKIGKYLFTK